MLAKVNAGPRSAAVQYAGCRAMPARVRVPTDGGMVKPFLRSRTRLPETAVSTESCRTRLPAACASAR